MKNTNDKKYCVYMHINKINNKIYIGQTKQNPHRRWQNGKGYLCKNKKGEYTQSHFAKSIIKYGWDNFEHIIWCDELTLQEANKAERLLIALYNTTNPKYGYNIKYGGNNYTFSKEIREKMSKNHADVSGKNNPMYGISKKGRNNPNYGKHHSYETRIKMRERHCDVSGANNPMYGVRVYGKDNPSAKSVICIEKNIIYDTATEASKQNNIDLSSIIKVCRGKLKSAGGYRWKYADDVNSENIAV